MGFLRRLQFVFNSGDELDGLIAAAKKNKLEAERTARMYHLDLCKKHQVLEKVCIDIGKLCWCIKKKGFSKKKAAEDYLKKIQKDL